MCSQLWVEVSKGSTDLWQVDVSYTEGGVGGAGEAVLCFRKYV